MRPIAPKTAASIAAVVALGIAIAGSAVVAFGGTPYFFGQEPATTPGVIRPVGALQPAKPSLPALPSPGGHEPGTIILPVEIPILTEAQIATAKQILANDPRAQMLLADLPYIVKETSVWVTEDYGVRGVGMIISLVAPVSPTAVIGDWPTTEHDPSSPVGYKEVVYKITPESLKQFTSDSLVQRFIVRMDLEKGTLI